MNETRDRYVTIDHQLQEQSGVQAEKVKAQLKNFGLDCIIKKVTVNLQDGLEASARKSRYQGLQEVATEQKAVAVFLGHTRDDQAETVLLGLARGSGTRSLSGMAHHNGLYIRPLLEITRVQNEQYCEEMKLQYWNDPHNQNPEFSRVRVRNVALPILEESIGTACLTSLNTFNGVPPTRCDKESALIQSGYFCSRSRSSRYKRSYSASGTRD